MDMLFTLNIRQSAVMGAIIWTFYISCLFNDLYLQSVLDHDFSYPLKPIQLEMWIVTGIHTSTKINMLKKKYKFDVSNETTYLLFSIMPYYTECADTNTKQTPDGDSSWCNVSPRQRRWTSNYPPLGCRFVSCRRAGFCFSRSASFSIIFIVSLKIIHTRNYGSNGRTFR